MSNDDGVVRRGDPETTGEIAIVGSGAFAQSICYSLSAIALPDRHVRILGRDKNRVDEISAISNSRARLLGYSTHFTGQPVDLESETALSSLLGERKPVLLVGCASYQSPWEEVTRASAWTRFLDDCGFGVTLPLQAVIAQRLARAIAADSPDTLFINACFPDCVNPLLSVLGLPVLCGVGNVALLSAFLQTELGLPDQTGLQVLAHHVHLKQPKEGEEEARVWLHGLVVTGVEALLARCRNASRIALLQTSGLSAALLIRKILAGEEVRASLPGPAGLPGGYPVHLQGRRFELDLPEQVSRSWAIERNQAASAADGVQTRPDGRIVFSPRAARVLQRYFPDIAEGFWAAELSDVCREMLTMRERFRVQ